MAKKAFFSTGELKRMAQLAKSECVTVEIVRDGTTVRVMPFSPTQITSSRAEDYFKDLGKPAQEFNPPKGKGGYPIPTGADDPLKSWYDGLGFDPKTMDQDDMKRLMAEAEARRKAEIPNRHMIKSELAVLEQLLEYGPGVQVHWCDIKGCGPGTADRLEARGFIEMCMQEKYPDRLKGYVLTEAGKEAALKIGRQP